MRIASCMLLISSLLASAVAYPQPRTITGVNGTPWPEVSYPYYNTSPTVMLDGSRFTIWNCGYSNFDGIGRDAISRSSIRQSQNQIVGEQWNGIVMQATGVGTGALSAWDSRHACSPSVVQHNNPELLSFFEAQSGLAAPGGGVYLMYYECEPQWFDSSQTTPTWIAGPTSICLAMSADGFRWFKWSDVDGDGSGVLREDDPVTNYPTPVIRSDDALALCSYSAGTDSQGRLVHRIDTTSCDPGNEYGAGHPSAMVVFGGQLVKVFYVDPSADHANGCNSDGLRSYWSRFSVDGTTFQGPARVTLTGETCDSSAGPSLTVALGFDDLNDDGMLGPGEPNIFVGTSVRDETNRLFLTTEMINNYEGLFPVESSFTNQQALGSATPELRSRSNASFVRNSKGQVDLGPINNGHEVTVFAPDYPAWLSSGDAWRGIKLHRMTFTLE